MIEEIAKKQVRLILVTIFSMLAELERDFISERTKEGLREDIPNLVETE